ncbi:hypothetical protein [Mesorhizobium sp. 113-1-2]|uniref:hypothetical protein n=1 Tax=Mesorhizobium sp. 113-1-2 TaxID=2744515 RepID=UPI0019264BC3|nr:hypothetical protein [Mesorhizobium sp. 113-1-2]
MSSLGSTVLGMQPPARALRGLRVAAHIFTCGLVLISCSKAPTDPRDGYDLEDAAELQPSIVEALTAANAALALDGQFILRPSWEKSAASPGPQLVPVYLLRRRHRTSPVEKSLDGARKALEAFRSELAKTKVDPRYENCSDADPCAALIYQGSRFADLVRAVYEEFSAVDSAATESACGCVMLMEEDLKKFEVIVGPSIVSGAPNVPVTWFVVWYILHEVGHLAPSYRLQPSASWAELYHRTQSGLNEKQREEMRADAYAAAVLGKACFGSPQGVRDVVGSACLGLAIQGMQLFFYGLFDKTEEGLKRQYLNDGKAHPNTLMRLLAMNVVMTNGDKSAVRLLSDFVDNREALAARLVSSRFQTTP